MRMAELERALEEQLVRRARRAYPLEACGFIMYSADPGVRHYLFEVPNVAKNPRNSFMMCPDHQRLACTDEENVFGMWHTHPRGPDGPSDTDRKFIPPGMRCFVATANGVFEYKQEG